MQLRVVDAAPGERHSHVLELVDLPELLAERGWHLQRVASGSRTTPVLHATLRGAIPVDRPVVAPVDLEIASDSTQAQLNARVIFRGLRSFLDKRFGYGRASRDGSELSLRVYFPGFGGTYVEREDAATDEPPSDRPRERVMAEIMRRRGSKKFRNALRERYEDRCVISECSIVDVLEAAHIRPYRVDSDNVPSNGLLLRADLHTLFDLDLVGIEPSSLCIRLHQSIQQAPYSELAGKPVQLRGHTLDAEALNQRWTAFQGRCEGDARQLPRQ